MVETSFLSRVAHSIGDSMAPVLTKSDFLRGVLTPEEFVLAGDLLSSKFPSWGWESGDASCRRGFLPESKQFLVTRGVPCRERASALAEGVGAASEEDAGDGWLATGFATREEGRVEVFDAKALQAAAGGGGSGGDGGGGEEGDGEEGGEKVKEDEDDDDYADMMTFDADDNLVADEATAPPTIPDGGSGKVHEAPSAPKAGEEDDGVEHVRRYDIFITYDNYYRTPRVFLVGVDEVGVRLSPETMMKDVYQDYANRTVTVERHPHLPDEGPMLSIHPCRHAAAMERVVQGILAAGIPQEHVATRPDTYLLFFLKFIQSVVPTMDYDFTADTQDLFKPKEGRE